MRNQDRLIPSRLSNEERHWNFCFADQMAIYVLLNLLYKDRPEKFGNPDTQTLLKEEIHGLIASKKIKYQPLIGEIGLLFQKHQINPLEDISVCFIGADDPDNVCIITPETEPLTSLFKNLRVLNAKNGREQYLHIDTYEKIMNGEKFDFVLTGNVLNDPKCRWPIGLFAACANITKQGGHTIHLTEYGSTYIGGANYGEAYTASLAINYFCGLKIDDAQRKQVTESRWNETLVDGLDHHYITARKYSDRVTTEEQIMWAQRYLSNRSWTSLYPLLRHIAMHPEILDQYGDKLPHASLFLDDRKIMAAVTDQDNLWRTQGATLPEFGQ